MIWKRIWKPSPYDSARWLSGSEAEIEKFAAANRGGMASDRDGAPVFLAKSAWELGYVAEKFPKREISQNPRTPRSPRRELGIARSCDRAFGTEFGPPDQILHALTRMNRFSLLKTRERHEVHAEN